MRPGQLPEPAGRRPAATPPPPLDATRVTGDFAHLGGRKDEDKPARFAVAYRPQDNMVLNGVPQPFAIVDTHEGNLPVSWCECRDWAEAMADMANRMRRST